MVFFEANKEFSWRIDAKAWEKQLFTGKDLSEFFSKDKTDLCRSVSSDLNDTAIGITVEWKPLNGIGFQSGLFFSKIKKDTTVLLDMNADGKVVPNCSTNGDQPYNHEIIPMYSEYLKFCTLSIPLSFRFYLGCDREFVLHMGPRFMMVLGDTKKNVASRIYYSSNGPTMQNYRIYQGIFKRCFRKYIFIRT